MADTASLARLLRRAAFWALMVVWIPILVSLIVVAVDLGLKLSTKVLRYLGDLIISAFYRIGMGDDYGAMEIVGLIMGAVWVCVLFFVYWVIISKIAGVTWRLVRNELRKEQMEDAERRKKLIEEAERWIAQLEEAAVAKEKSACE
jgi:hypothetical protein